MEGITSEQGRITTETEDGRQKITYLVPPGNFDDVISYRLHIGYDYLWSQFWYYPTIPAIILSLLVIRWRIRRKRRRERRNARRARKAERRGNSGDLKQMSDADFDSLLGVNSPNMGIGLHEEGLLPDYMDEDNRFN